MLWEIIGDLISLDNGAIDPDDPWHYARKLTNLCVNYKRRTNMLIRYLKNPELIPIQKILFNFYNFL